MAEGACTRGDAVRVWNRTAARAEPLAEHGASVHADVGAAVDGVEVVHVVLTHDAAVDGVLALLDGSLASLAARDVPVVDHSTTSPAGTAARSARLQAAGVRYLHAPVFMSPNAARAAQGTMIVAGPQASFDQVQPLLAPMCATLQHVGTRPDLAAAMKLFGNAMNLSMLHGLADILAMAEGLDISPTDALNVFGVIDVRYVIEGRGRNMAAADYDPLWTVDVARKDVALMTACAEGRETPALNAIAATLDGRKAAGEGELDVAVMGRREPRPE
jgi:3-hydroxyisobutyrate dehydrogenase-like beta-hydroxyacid dehydrogenase